MNEELILKKMKVNLYNLHLEHPIIMGAGLAKCVEGPEGLQGFSSRINASLYMGGSFTYLPKDGNSGEVCGTEGFYTINRMGLPNKGIEELKKLKKVSNAIHKKNKKVGISIYFENNSKELEDLIQCAIKNKTDIIEINISCPNVTNKISGQQIFELIQFLSAKKYAFSNICLKLPYFSNIIDIQQIAYFINETTSIKGISAINTLPNALVFKKDKLMINNISGLSGPSIYPLALGQVFLWRKYLFRNKYIIGGGGITTAQDVINMRKVGADAVFMVSALMNNHDKYLDAVLDDLIELESKDI